MSSKFIQSSSSFSETHLLKSKYLAPILEAYNKLILVSNKIQIKESQKYMIPNNNNKFYLFITNKINITNNKNDTKYKILYFFPSTENKNDLFGHLIIDFYVEIDSNKCSFPKSNYLFEGFLYNKNAFNTFLITDILSVDNIIVDCKYSLRYQLINNIIKEQNLYNLNGHLNIDIHNMFEFNSDTYLNILGLCKNNFQFKNDINSLQIIDDNNLIKTNTENKNKDQDKIIKKRITKGKFIDVYNVFNIETNNYEGILYVKTIKNSKDIKSMFEYKESVETLCEYSSHFRKWYPVL